MIEELRKLKKLQAYDEQIYRREEELDALPEENAALEARIAEMEGKLTELRNGIALQQEEIRKRTEIVARGEEKLKAITGKQSAIRNKDEYNALLREIDNIKRFNKEVEEEAGEITREMEIRAQELKLVEEEHLAKIAECRQKLNENRKRIASLEREIEKMYEDRDKLTAGIRPAVLRKYERILESSSSGKAIAEADKYLCRGCNMTLPPQLYHNVLKAERIETCPNCQCILIPSESRRSEKEKKEPVIRDTTTEQHNDDD